MAISILYIIIVILVMLLLLWIVFSQLQKDNKIGAFLVYFVTSFLSTLFNGKFSLVNIVFILISSLISYAFSSFCYKKCKGTFGSFVLTQIIWGIILGLIIFAVYFIFIMITVGSIKNSFSTFNVYT